MQHHFDHATRLYTHSSDMMVNPRKPAQFLSLAFATADALPALKPDEVAQRNADDTAWLVFEDHRASLAWHTETKERITINDVGPLPAHLTVSEPSAYDSWQNGAWVTDTAAVLQAARDAAANAVRDGFSASIKQPVAANDTTWNGGMDSALAIDGAVRLAEQMGQTEIDLFDAANQAYSLDIGTGRTIAAAVGAVYQVKLARKQQLLRDIASVSSSELDALIWTD
ncbi:hypothetical protein [Neptunomonas antarctica]|uniref:DUF4376 domain-containing protein n=1 Tax=Neptunomonas antarctica TaxID=619304 RepID=A0A1N7MNK2_9GAMM|nr:hypothetical protein [Neptunomonas antarctica]SIS87723.1 hypothetical protein SAMN05421760_106225 [Neptunomonas antarctica]